MDVHMEDKKEQRRRTIEALLAKAQSSTFKEEAEEYRAKAEFLMVKYGIEDAFTRDKEHKHEKPTHTIFAMFNPYAARKYTLIRMVAWFLDAFTVIENKNVSSGRAKVYVFAYKDDLERIKVLYTSLLVQMHIEMMDTPIPRGVHGKTFRNSWMIGFCDGVFSRLNQVKNRVLKEVPGTDLVLVKRKDQIDNVVKSMFPDMHVRSHQEEATHEAAYSRGQAAGLRADIGQDRMGSDQRRHISG